MASLLRAIDRASGYVFAGARAMDEEGRTLKDDASIWAQAMSDHWAGKMEVRDVQERWIERKDEFDQMEREEWKEEARLAGALPEQAAAKVVPTPADQQMSNDGNVEAEDDLIAEQLKWKDQAAKGGGGGGGPKVVRKG